MRRHTTTVFLCTSIPAQRANTTSIRVAPPLALAPSASLRESPNGGDSGARGGVDTRAAASHLRAPADAGQQLLVPAGSPIRLFVRLKAPNSGRSLCAPLTPPSVAVFMPTGEPPDHKDCYGLVLLT